MFPGLVYNRIHYLFRVKEVGVMSKQECWKCSKWYDDANGVYTDPTGELICKACFTDDRELVETLKTVVGWLVLACLTLVVITYFK